MGQPTELVENINSLSLNLAPSITLDTLPEDPLVGIFHHLNLRDQTRLGASCSRFHTLNRLKAPRNLDAVVVFWGDNYHYVNTYDSYKDLRKARCWMRSWRPTETEEFEIDESFFAKARTNILEIAINARDVRPFRLLSPLFRTLQYTSLEIDFRASERNNTPLLRSLITGRILRNSSLRIQWSRAVLEDIGDTRQLLMEFPIVKNLHLTWIYWGVNSLETEVITDAIMLYLVDRCTEDLLVGEGDCSLQGLLAVYEKLIECKCQHVQVTVRWEVAQAFIHAVEKQKTASDHVHVITGKNSNHKGRGISMSRLTMTKKQY
ncbi:hypothetical protein PENTCL1PPCAC_417, partial [Pristionchus entomophagus]